MRPKRCTVADTSRMTIRGGVDDVGVVRSSSREYLRDDLRSPLAVETGHHHRCVLLRKRSHSPGRSPKPHP
jgi:hypothetical protein